MEAFQGFNITVAGKSRFVPSHGMIKIMSAAGESTHTRRKSESAEKFQERIEADIAHRLKQQVRVRRAHTCSHSRCRIFYALTVLALPLQADLERQKSTRQYRSPEHVRPVRQVGTTGKPSDESQTLTAPPPSKRSSAADSSASQPGDFGQAREREQQSRQKQDRIRMPPPPSRAPPKPSRDTHSTGRRQFAAAVAQQAPDTNDASEFPRLGGNLLFRGAGGQPEFGLTQRAAGVAALEQQQQSRGHKQHQAALVAASKAAAAVSAAAVAKSAAQAAGAGPTPPPTPLGIVALMAVDQLYESPLTVPHEPPAKAVTRAGKAAAQGNLEARLGGLEPGSHPQRAVQLSEQEKRDREAKRKRDARARDRKMAEATAELMLELARFDLPLVQLLLAEFASDPMNAGDPGQMRYRFLEQYAATCHTKHADTPSAIKELPKLAKIIKAHRPARELLRERLSAAKTFTAESYSGAHRLGAVVAGSCETLMHLRQRIFMEQRRSGATPKDLLGSGDFMPKLRATKAKGKFLLEYRHAAHVHRYASHSLPVSACPPLACPPLLRRRHLLLFSASAPPLLLLLYYYLCAFLRHLPLLPPYSPHLLSGSALVSSTGTLRRRARSCRATTLARPLSRGLSCTLRMSSVTTCRRLARARRMRSGTSAFISYSGRWASGCWWQRYQLSHSHLMTPPSAASPFLAQACTAGVPMARSIMK